VTAAGRVWAPVAGSLKRRRWCRFQRGAVGRVPSLRRMSSRARPHLRPRRSRRTGNLASAEDTGWRNPGYIDTLCPSLVKYQLLQPDIHVVLGEAPLDAFVVAALHIVTDIEIAQIAVQDGGDTADGVVELALDVHQQANCVRGRSSGPS